MYPKDVTMHQACIFDLFHCSIVIVNIRLPGWSSSLSTIHILTDESSDLTAVITNESMAELGISEGKRIVALIKASSVLLEVKQPPKSA